MEPSSACTDNIKEFETCAKRQSDGTVKAYPDPGTGGAPWTIGWGSTGADIKRGTVWTQAQCDARFAHDVAGFAQSVTRALGGAATTQHQFDALVSFAYNVRGWEASTLLKLHKKGDFVGAQLQFSRWVFGRDENNRPTRLGGLVRRRDAEAALYGRP